MSDDLSKAAAALSALSHAGPPSEARKAASRENGKKGGRPRKKTRAAPDSAQPVEGQGDETDKN